MGLLGNQAPPALFYLRLMSPEKEKFLSSESVRCIWSPRKDSGPGWSFRPIILCREVRYLQLFRTRGNDWPWVGMRGQMCQNTWDDGEGKDISFPREEHAVRSGKESRFLLRHLSIFRIWHFPLLWDYKLFEGKDCRLGSQTAWIWIPFESFTVLCIQLDAQ